MTLISFFLLLFVFQTHIENELPEIRTTPAPDGPQLLPWPEVLPFSEPDLTEPTANQLHDLQGIIKGDDIFDLVISTSGNYHMALSDFFHNAFLPEHQEIETWFITTSPPVSAQQIYAAQVTFGNLRLKTRPHIAIGPLNHLQQIIDNGFADSEPLPVVKNRGNVILVKKGNPKQIETVFDLARPEISVVTPHPDREPASFGNYARTIYNVALNAENSGSELSARDLFDAVFNSEEPDKWLSGARIHHREIPWSVAYGRGDAAIVFHHLGRYLIDQFPDYFDLVPIGGTVEEPDPLPGNPEGTLYALTIKGEWTEEQLRNRSHFMQAIQGDVFRNYLQNYHLDLP